ncbi:type VII secretion target [Nocardia sp. BMG111209]|uniref:type VII secretion target n=1 Tax=Nocardia sp. BMG111209 TaxID=1160137 RepID=UPI00037F2AD8|nr:type VII secretion target [Nocardia sp. BMG111209]
MNGGNELRVDPAGLRQLADRVGQSAEALARCTEPLGDSGFGAGTDAGRDYAGQGAAVRAGVERLAGRLRQWGTATAATATAMHDAADSYAAAEQNNAHGVAGTGDH